MVCPIGLHKYNRKGKILCHMIVRSGKTSSATQFHLWHAQVAETLVKSTVVLVAQQDVQMTVRMIAIITAKMDVPADVAISALRVVQRNV